MKKTMKKILTVGLAVAALSFAASALSACTPRDKVLKIYTWNAYTDAKYINDEFPKFYERKTGLKISRVDIKSFDTNETMYEKVVTEKADYDLICPSDYAVERLVKENFLKKIDKNIVTSFNDALDPEILEKVTVFDPEHEYALPYAWGTMGIMYNTGKPNVAAENMTSWNILWNKTPSGGAAGFDVNGKWKIYMKDSAREAFTAANFYNNKSALENIISAEADGYASDAYQTALKKIFAPPKQSDIDNAKTALSGIKSVWELEDGKGNLQNDKDEAYLGLFWSCDAGLAMAGDDGNLGNDKLRYAIPTEGSNFYADCFVIPKTARNETAAQWFLEFLTDTETAYKNTLAAGTASGVTAANERYKNELQDELDKTNAEIEDMETRIADMTDGAAKDAVNGLLEVFRNRADFLDNLINVVLFPDSETLSRCGVMRDYGDMNSAVADMFIAVR